MTSPLHIPSSLPTFSNFFFLPAGRRESLALQPCLACRPPACFGHRDPSVDSGSFSVLRSASLSCCPALLLQVPRRRFFSAASGPNECAVYDLIGTYLPITEHSANGCSLWLQMSLARLSAATYTLFAVTMTVTRKKYPLKTRCHARVGWLVGYMLDGYPALQFSYLAL